MTWRLITMNDMSRRKRRKIDSLTHLNLNHELFEELRKSFLNNRVIMKFILDRRNILKHMARLEFFSQLWLKRHSELTWWRRMRITRMKRRRILTRNTRDIRHMRWRIMEWTRMIKWWDESWFRFTIWLCCYFDWLELGVLIKFMQGSLWEYKELAGNNMIAKSKISQRCQTKETTSLNDFWFWSFGFFDFIFLIMILKMQMRD